MNNERTTNKTATPQQTLENLRFLLYRHFGGDSIDGLETQIDALRAKPLRILCRTPAGLEEIMTVSECVRSGAVYIHIVEDELDQLLCEELSAVYVSKAIEDPAETPRSIRRHNV